ncbi:hypothetical protein HT118_05125 [Escherichia coli]|nr:hypothetical protein [Escherichia coli]
MSKTIAAMVLIPLKIDETFSEGRGDAQGMRGEGASYRDVTSRPYPIAVRNKSNVPRSGDFVPKALGRRGWWRLSHPGTFTSKIVTK